ncbi:putative bifunctional diguanylate cyclase/phosphodiesterase [Shewanella aestuarii]|uniref:Bifunctional diguanylate cyclase/phosphodiesterase n=1 Tax=Shewanella aestuarii TaxID=1028752 RepID=A0A6G9QIC7_9GAMM|nr:bifunctional diguanylate cyclase/phosphodiesterase [Shewanella aestuarii]QIR13815.1 bifunctional diguanylate cyclase/phosphodiesterase [Shewanella aestuarii]
MNDAYWLSFFVSLLSLVVIVGGLYCWRQHRYLQFLTHIIEKQLINITPIDVGATPNAFLPLIRALLKLQQSIPFNVEKDKLTGLFNRVGFKRKIVSQMPNAEGMIILVDIKQFRFVNDLFGFVFGDHLLKAFAERIASMPLQAQFVARMNGNEFLLFFNHNVSAAQLSDLKQRLQLPFYIEQQPISVKVQMGVLAMAEHHADVSIMLRRLDLALKKAKQYHQDIAYYDQGDDKKQYRELLIINSLPKSLKQNQLFMVYQPKVETKTGQCVQVEALIRWHHDGLGNISPDEFIPLAEKTGMISLISHWVLDKVISQLATWREQGVFVKVAINLSGADMHSDNLVEDINKRLHHYRVPADSLMVEITESALMESYTQAIDTIERLQAIGVKVAIDDFGTGHSSLAYLRYLPVNEVKIDKAFLSGFEQDEQAKNIVKMTIALAKELGFEVTVEGVETLTVYHSITAFGADRIQGDIFAKPMAADGLEQALIRFHAEHQQWKIDENKQPISH